MHFISKLIPFNSKSLLLVLIASVMITISSCAPGKRTASRFLEKRENIAVMLVPPSFTFLYYYPFDIYMNPGYADAYEDIEQSYFLRNTDIERADSIFVHALNESLREFNLKVFNPEEFDMFLSHEGKRFIFTLAQTELVEYDRIHTDRALVDTILYRQEFLLRTVERNTWFEFVTVDEQPEDAGMKVLYSTLFTADNINGRFRYRGLTGEMLYEYQSYLIDQEDIYAMNRFAGQRNARYIFEFLMNNYVEENARRFILRPSTFRYNPRTNNLSRQRGDDGFIILQTE